MEVKPGYKQTEVGVIPEVWEALPARQVGVFRGGSGFPLTAQGDTRGEYPFFKVSDMNNEGNETFMTTANHYISEQTRRRLGATAFPAESIVFAKVGAAVFLERKKILGQPSCIDNNMAAFVLDQARVDVRFMHSLLLSKKLSALVATTALPALNGKQLGEMTLPVPPLPEQRAIAAALSDVDALLGVLDRLIAKKRDLKQAAMQQLLTGQTRLPGFSGEWELKRLGDVISHCSSGATPRRNRPEFYGGDIRWITSGELNYNVITDTVEKISREAVVETNLAMLPAGTFLMAITGLEAEGTRGACGIVGAPSTTNQSCMAVFPTGALLTEYLFHYYVFRGKQLALQYCQGTKQQSYTASLVKQLPIGLPPAPSEQRAIAAVLSDMDAELTALEARRAKTRELKQGMMQELLTGKTRLVPTGGADA
jgi:type I restriction enzyme, S subunit